VLLLLLAMAGSVVVNKTAKATVATAVATFCDGSWRDVFLDGDELWIGE
jgi:hypothetical protein